MGRCVLSNCEIVQIEIAKRKYAYLKNVNFRRSHDMVQDEETDILCMITLKKENHLNIKLKTAQKCSCITKLLSRNEIDMFPEAKNNGKLKQGNPMQKRDFCKKLQWK